ncbi:hypothetical protein PCAR4_570261 [Paraburkholderia caribensis]|nr:hypothetical protein PCAR4_570261 [Paraburkholderia caribensis]
MAKAEELSTFNLDPRRPQSRSLLTMLGATGSIASFRSRPCMSQTGVADVPWLHAFPT